MSHGPLSADQELQRLTHKSSAALEATLQDLITVKAAHGDEREVHTKLREQLTQVLALSSLLGRRRVLIQARAKAANPRGVKAALARQDLPEGFLASADIVNPFIPTTKFEEAITDLLKRHPVLAPGYKRVQQQYARGHAFALAKSTDEVVTRRVQKTLASAFEQGSERWKTVDLIASLGDWTKSYSQVVYATNSCTAYAAGVIAQAHDPDIRSICPAMTIQGPTISPPSRKNHVACVGLIAQTDDPIWNRYAPPLGHQCRHGLNMCDKWDLKKMNLIAKDGSVRQWRPPNFAQGHPDEGFGVGTLGRRLGLVSP